MLIAAKQIHGCSIEGPGGVFGKVRDLLFDGESWKVRYLDVDTDGWLRGHRVLLAPEAIQCTDYAAQRLGTPMTREQVEASPPLESHLPVSRKQEIEEAQYMAWEAYWAHVEPAPAEIGTGADAKVHSTHAVSRFHIETADGKSRHVDDFIIDDRALEGVPWEIRYLVVDVRHWLPGKQVLICPRWAEAIDWGTRRVSVRLTREMIENSPEYHPDAPINRRYEEVCHDFYGRPADWAETPHHV